MWQKKEKNTGHKSHRWVHIIGAALLILIELTQQNGATQYIQPYPKLAEWPFKQGELSDTTPIPVGQHWRCAVASPHSCTLRQDLLQFWGGTTRDQCANQGQGVVIEITLQWCEGS